MCVTLRPASPMRGWSEDQASPACFLSRVRIARPAARAWGARIRCSRPEGVSAERSQPPRPQRLNAWESLELRLSTHSYVVRTMNGWFVERRGRRWQIGRQKSHRWARRWPEALLVPGHQGFEGSDPAARGEILQQRQFIGHAALAGLVGHATPMPRPANGCSRIAGTCSMLDRIVAGSLSNDPLSNEKACCAGAGGMRNGPEGRREWELSTALA